MHRALAGILMALFLVPLAHAEETKNLTRDEGFSILWEAIKRPAEKMNETPFKDVDASNPHFTLLTFAKARGILNDNEKFFPEDSLTLKAALIWLLRTRNVAYPDDITEETLMTFITQYPLGVGPDDLIRNDTLTETKLREMMTVLDNALKNEHHIISFYSDDFAGKGTAFGEKFDPNALTAAHRTFPVNTLVKVTNTTDGRSVIVRINDRGPYVEGRDMDLSRAAFEQIGKLSSGVLADVTFERLGDEGLVNVGTNEPIAFCPQTTFRKRLGETVLTPGIPTLAPVGTSLTLTADHSFRLIQMRAPGMKVLRSREWTKELDISFNHAGIYTFILHADDGKRMRFRTRVVVTCK